MVDLGSGDGRIVIAAAKQYQARGLGIDYDQTLIAESRANAAREGVSDKVDFLHRDIFLADFHDATVVTMYLLPEVNLEIRPRILFVLRPGTRVVSHDWDMGDWRPARRLVVAAPTKTVGLKKQSYGLPLDRACPHRGLLARDPHGAGWRGVDRDRVRAAFPERFGYRLATAMESGRKRPPPRRQPVAHSRPVDLDARLGTTAFSLRSPAPRLEGEAADGHQRYLLRATRIVE